MNCTQLKYFMAVYEARSIKAAAEKLFISSQGLSRTILFLEKELGYELFDRSGKKMIPTASAELFRTHAEKILQEFDVLSDGRFLKGAERKRLKIFHTYGVIECLGIDFLNQFMESHPNILPALIEIPDRDAIARLGRGDGELAILSDCVNLLDYEVIPLKSQKYCFVVNTDNPLAENKFIRMEDFDGRDLIVKGRELSLSDYQLSELAKRNIIPHIALETTNYYLAAAMAQKNRNVIALTLESIAEIYLPEHTAAIPYGEDIEKPLFLVYRKNAVMSKEAEEFLVCLANHFGIADADSIARH